jgi:hypothetical protein
MHNLYSARFVNLYMFWAYLDPSSGGKTVYIQQLILIIFLDDQDNRQSSKENNKYQLLYTHGCNS